MSCRHNTVNVLGDKCNVSVHWKNRFKAVKAAKLKGGWRVRINLRDCLKVKALIVCNNA